MNGHSQHSILQNNQNLENLKNEKLKIRSLIKEVLKEFSIQDLSNKLETSVKEEAENLGLKEAIEEIQLHQVTRKKI